jgi:hypothetical protein
MNFYSSFQQFYFHPILLKKIVFHLVVHFALKKIAQKNMHKNNKKTRIGKIAQESLFWIGIKPQLD